MAILNVKITKANGRTLDLDTNSVPEGVYAYMLELGAKHLLNLGTSSLDRDEYKTDAEFHDAAYAIAEKQLAKVMSGDVRRTGGAKAKKGAEGAIATEALRLAKIVAKQQIKDAGIKISTVAASDITKVAKALIAKDEAAWHAQARASLSAAAPPVVDGTFDLKSMVKPDPKKVKAAEKKAAEAKAAKAGKTAPAAKPAPKAKPSPTKHA